eukprot:313832-Chlamydomonas_euryale.AAC.1
MPSERAVGSAPEGVPPGTGVAPGGRGQQGRGLRTCPPSAPPSTAPAPCTGSHRYPARLGPHRPGQAQS